VALTGLALEGAWLLGRARLALRREHHRLPPAGRGHATYLTCIARVPAEVARRLEPALERLRARAHQHHYYEPHSLHVTIRNLDALGAGRLDDARAVIASHPPFALAARGLNLSRRTVFAEVRPLDGTLRSLRRSLAGLVGARDGLLPDLAFANVVRFSGRVDAPFVRELAALRRRDFGSWIVEEVELVRTDRLLSREGTEVLERVRLGA
jgi:2'-5' RNA ligase